MNNDKELAAEPWAAPYMPWFESDFFSFNVRKMAPLARLMYRSLLQQAWHSDNPPYIPNDDADLMLMADAPSQADWEEHKESILKRLTQTEDGKWLFHPKAVREYSRAKSIHDRKQLGAHNRWQEGTSKGPIGIQEDTSKSPISKSEDASSPIPIPNLYLDNQNPCSNSFSEHAEKIYDSYPRKVGRRKALVEIRSALRRLVEGENGPPLSLDDAESFLLKRTRQFAGTPAGQAGRFTPHPSTWFHQSRYRDDPLEWARGDREVEAPGRPGSKPYYLPDDQDPFSTTGAGR